MEENTLGLRRFHIPETVITDNGTQFRSSAFKKMCEQLGIIHIRTAPYHPQSNGQAERFVDTLKQSLRKIVYRSTPSAALAGKSPVEEMLGRLMRTILGLLQPPVFNCRQCPEFTTGSTVYAKLYDNVDKWKWDSVTVIEAIGAVNFNVLLDYQSGRRKLIHSHVNQLRSRINVAVKPSVIQTLLDIMVDHFELKQHPSVQQIAPQNFPSIDPERVPVDQHQPDSSDNDELFEVEAGSTISSQATVQPIPRLATTSRLPMHLEDYVVG
ncbi:uncharacterized protein K02A2.6-like [Toxorhynchites rutilus septentrionalis]|uniref:uncharacterized protein K02A2.6-like n=1 Tax=Toxorhynchites rutilus septentrionalis TaxID=329112 RepID=UPI00247A9079|nr:uncharacterized protein K02A2.6-like [Toxorhynchites rutilus septentrionalis]